MGYRTETTLSEVIVDSTEFQPTTETLLKKNKLSTWLIITDNQNHQDMVKRHGILLLSEILVGDFLKALIPSLLVLYLHEHI